MTSTRTLSRSVGTWGDRACRRCWLMSPRSDLSIPGQMDSRPPELGPHGDPTPANSGGSAHPLHRRQTRAKPPNRSSRRPSSIGSRRRLSTPSGPESSCCTTSSTGSSSGETRSSSPRTTTTAHTHRVRRPRSSAHQRTQSGGSANLRSKARVRHFPLEWRWRELNPRPTMLAQVFSGCSSQCVVFGPSAHANKSLTDLAA